MATITIQKTSKPDFECDFLGERLVFKNANTLPALFVEKMAKIAGMGGVFESLREGARDLEKLNKSLENAEQGDVIELYRVWNEHARESIKTD